jgi:hypothetical protein
MFGDELGLVACNSDSRKIPKFYERSRVSDLILRFLRIQRLPLRSGQAKKLFGRDRMAERGTRTRT